MRLAIVAATVLFIAIVALNHAIANVARERQPGLALRFVPEHPVALAAKANSEFRLGRQAEAARLSREAIAATALSSDAYEILALIRATGPSQEVPDQLFRYTSRLSRREGPTQIWLFHQELLQGDVESALRHADAAMRVSEKSRPTLYLLLASALASESMIQPVTKLLMQDPIWLPGFINYSIKAKLSLSNLARVVAALPEESASRSTGMQAALVRGLAETGEYSRARAFMDSVAAAPAEGLIRDGFFVRSGPYIPFDWNYVRGAELGASPVGPKGGLKYFARSGSGGRVARQLVSLSPGRYVMQSEGRRLSLGTDGGATWTIACAAQPSNPLLQLRMSDPKGEATFVVPAEGCDEQLIDLVLTASFGPGGLEGIIDSVAIVSASAAAEEE